MMYADALELALRSLIEGIKLRPVTPASKIPMRATAEACSAHKPEGTYSSCCVENSPLYTDKNLWNDYACKAPGRFQMHCHGFVWIYSSGVSESVLLLCCVRFKVISLSVYLCHVCTLSSLS
jgi:hypothetical protein